MTRHFSNRNRKKDRVHPSHLLNRRQLEKATHATVGMQSSISADVAFAKTVGLVVQRRLLPKQIWLMRDATTQELIVEYEPRSGICYTAIDGKSHHVRKWSVRQAIQFASQHLAKPQSKDGISCPTPERVNRPTSDSDSISQPERNICSTAQRDAARELGIRAIPQNYQQYKLQASETNEVLYIYDQFEKTCASPGLRNRGVYASSLDVAFRLAVERFRLPQVTGTSIVSIFNRTLNRTVKCTLFELGTEHLGKIEVVSTDDPLGSHLMKKRQGDIFAVNVSDGIEEFEILRIAEP